MKESDLTTKKRTHVRAGEYGEDKELNIDEIIDLFQNKLWHPKRIAKFKLTIAKQAHLQELLIEKLGQEQYDSVMENIKALQRFG